MGVWEYRIMFLLCMAIVFLIAFKLGYEFGASLTEEEKKKIKK